MRIAAEGEEEAALAGADLNAYRPWIILIDAGGGQPEAVEPKRWEPLLVAAGYSFVRFDGRCRFYIATSRAHGGLPAAFNAPPNSLDDFISAAEHDLRSELAAADADRCGCAMPKPVLTPRTSAPPASRCNWPNSKRTRRNWRRS
ncbi:MAG: hypothetical protein U1E33_08475 [Rhodospirillales bacterium]